MPHRNLNDVPDFDGIFVVVLGVWGATMNYLKRKDKNYTFIRKLGLFALDILTSGGIAIITYLVVLGYTDNAVLSVGVSGVFAHLGTRGFYIFEQIVVQKLGVKL